MKRSRVKNKNLLCCCLSVFAFCSLSFVCFATVKSAGGGTWDYGVGNTCFSNYLHNRYLHGSTAVNGEGDVDVADGIDAGEWSYACVSATTGHLFNRNKAYWHRCGMDKKCGYEQD